MDSIIERPESFPFVYQDVRRCMMKKFPYGVFFRLIDDAIHIIGVVHLHQDQRVWQRRA